jgi:hypothetical protein
LQWIEPWVVSIVPLAVYRLIPHAQQ